MLRLLRLRNVVLMILVAMLLAVIAACSPKVPPNTSPEGTLAIKGRAVVNAARAAVPLIDQQMEAGRIPKDAGIKVLLGIRQVYIQAGTLANALDIVDRAKNDTEGQTGLSAAKAALASISKALEDGLTGLSGELVTSLRQLLRNLTDAIEEVRSVVASASPGGALVFQP